MRVLGVSFASLDGIAAEQRERGANRLRRGMGSDPVPHRIAVGKLDRCVAHQLLHGG